MTTLPGFVAKCERAATGIVDANRIGVEAAALAAKGVVLAEMQANGVTPGKKLAGVPNGRINARYTVQTGAATTTALLALTGPAHLVNNPTKPHDITPRGSRTPGGRRRKRAGAKALKTPFGIFAVVHSPGTQGKHFWEKAQPGVRAAVPVAVRKAHQAQLLKEFHG